jgi:putative ABC transport system permease protein
VKEFRSSIGKFAEKYFGKYIENERERQKLSDTVKIFEVAFNPLTAIHLDKNIPWYDVSDITYSYVLGGIGALIFFIACINFISLSVSGSASRSTEVGIRKVLGAGRFSVARQFWGESLGLVILAVLLGILLASVMIHPFNRFSGKTLSVFSSANLRFYFFIILVTFLTALFAGAYPSIYLSGFQPVEVLKRKSSTRYNLGFTRTLVVLQYALSGILITSSLVMFGQMRFITTRDLGYDEEQVIVIPTYTGWSDDGERLVNNLKNELQGMGGINSVSGTNFSFNRGGWSKNGFNINGKEHYAYIYRVDPNYVKTLGMQILTGRDFIQGNSHDMYHGIIINEALAKDMGWENPVGEHLYWREDSVADEIIGVVRDYHFQSFTEKIEPVILALSPQVSKVMMAIVKMSPENIPGALGNIEKIWKSQNPDKPFDYSFLDQDVANQYSAYQRWMKIMGYSTAIAILIACLGLFGLAGISASNRTKEISIRKVFGADISSLFIMMNREVVALGIISFIFATPVSWYFMSRWLNSFVYHIALSWQIFLGAAVAGIIVAVITVSYHSIRTSLVNPSEILKYE